jgi:hypothetical protein
MEPIPSASNVPRACCWREDGSVAALAGPIR